MKYRNLALVFMVLMLAGLISTFFLFFELKNTKEVVVEKDDTIRKSRDSLQLLVNELETSQSILELEKGKSQKLIDSVNRVCPSLSQIQDMIENELSVGLSYKTSNKLDAIKEYIHNLNFEIYYEKQAGFINNSYVIYYDNGVKENAEKIAQDLKNKTGFDFKALKGQSPESIKNANISKTLIIHVNN